MLSFQEKLDICSSYPELQRRDVSLGRVNFHYEESAHEKKTVVYHLHPNGNGYVYGGLVPGVSADDKGFVNIRDYSADELRSLIRKSIDSLTGPASGEAARPAQAAAEGGESGKKQRWVNEKQETLTVHYEDELWYIYAGANLESACETYEEVEEYMQEEGFRLAGEALA
jgi:hypothetical protein